jgi:hypothetical protein
MAKDPKDSSVDEMDEFIAAGGDTGDLFTGKGRLMQPGESLAAVAQPIFGCLAGTVISNELEVTSPVSETWDADRD